MAKPEAKEEVLPDQPLGSDPDVERDLARMQEIKDHISDLEDEYGVLRDKTTPVLESPRYFIDGLGRKRYGFRVSPTKTEIHLDKLIIELHAGTIDEATFNAVTEVTVNRDKFKRAAQRKKIPDGVLQKVVTETPQTPHVRFSDPRED